ncbi:MAG TPA: hypothetical protein VFB60_16130 [Ktedonobacteraceae bacterium]|nr:hypothetical protein [Ktedonobacteraceae bacterium]
MITQAIKHWMSKLFAWWPWRKSSDTGYVQTVSNLKKNAAQETLWRAAADGPGPQPSVTSVVIEQGRSETSPSTDRPVIDEHAEQVAQSSPSPIEESAPPSQSPSKELPQGRTEDSPTPSPTFEQRLVFLRHLVKRGVINEGFAEGKVPDQYKKP